MDKILVAMSGGVDSSVAALLLKKQGVEVTGAYMKNWINEDNVFGDCPWKRDLEDARRVAEQLDIDFRVVNLMDAYKQRIVDYLLEGYQKGLTPNPDVMCNREIKFGVFLDYALAEGFDGVATGHYARVEHADMSPPRLFEGADSKKDQSYFLSLVRPEQLARAWFPIGSLQKKEVRHLAERAGLVNAKKKDSQGICFIGNIRMSDFLRHYLENRPGEIVDTSGCVLGRHDGLHLFTLGQRRGIGVPSNTDHRFYVVVGKDLVRNRLIVAFESMDAPGLYQESIRLHHLSWLRPPTDGRRMLMARPRYLDPRVNVEFVPDEDGATLRFEAPQRALASGQVVALYEDNELVGGGIYV